MDVQVDGGNVGENYLSGNSFRFGIYVGKYKEGEGGGGKGKI